MLLRRRIESSEIAARYVDVIDRIAREHHVPRTRAEQWFEELVRFLDLAAGSSLPLAPSKRVDKAWHEFVLFTREYEEFCRERYGRFLHHDPYGKPDREAYVRTYMAYTERYGAPPRRVWRNPFLTGGGTGGTICGGSGDGGGDGGAGCGGGGCGGGG
jgi:hypothetical protein